MSLPPSAVTALKQKILVSIENIPLEGLREVASFLDYLHYRFQKQQAGPPKYKPIALGGLWKGTEINEDDIEAIRKEMWSNLGEKKL
jgi:hypothetical protein